MADENDIDLGDVIDAAAQGPAIVQTPAATVTQQPLDKLIQADQYRKGQAALAGGKSAWGATRPARVIPPNALGC